MIDIAELKQSLIKTNEVFLGCCRAINLSSLRDRREVLLESINVDGFYDDIKKAAIVNTELSRINEKIDKCSILQKSIDDCFEMIELLRDENETELLDEFASNIDELNDKIANLHILTLFRGEYDSNNAIISIHAGAGGTEAQDWANMLYRMYKMYCDKASFKLKEIDYLIGDEAGIKGVTFFVTGNNAYGYLSAEKGVHRLVRISPFDSNSRRHTSFASVEVMPEIENPGLVEIRQEDLKIDTYRSGGAGGQHVNKTESAIRITHIPSGIVVACQNERSQIQNRETAMGMLRSKLIEKKEREAQEKAQSIQGNLKKIEWGSQIRSYVFAPYTLVKDHRTGYENSNIYSVMDGNIKDFIVDYLEKK